jgi:AbrB family looped-hinge helix DNA binding protein
MTVKVSPKYQVVIPEKVRAALQIKVGSKVEVVAKGNVAYLVPVLPLEKIQELFHQKIKNAQVDIRDKKDRKI